MKGGGRNRRIGSGRKRGVELSVSIEVMVEGFRLFLSYVCC